MSPRHLHAAAEPANAGPVGAERDSIREVIVVGAGFAGIGAAIKEVLGASGVKMPQLAMPVRVLALGTPQTPSLDAVLELLDREKVIARLSAA